MKLITGIKLGILCTCTVLLGCAAAKITAKGDMRRVNNIIWQQQVDVRADELLAKKVPNNMTRLVFMRKLDADDEQSRANIAINDRFQVSLHPGNYTQVYSCVGMNNISVVRTGLKTNDLLMKLKPFELQGGQTYYFDVNVDGNNQSAVQLIEAAKALPALRNKRYQSHQISRVVTDNCPPAPISR